LVILTLVFLDPFEMFYSESMRIKTVCYGYGNVDMCQGSEMT